jgi:hypothetical protein
MEPLKFVVHVPKTAGSSINAALRKYNPNGMIHCESIIHNEDALRQAVDTMDWLSGHVDLTTAIKALERATKRTVQYYACIRSPAGQVASHYNWLIEIFHKGPKFYDTHPPIIKEISEQIRASNYDSVGSIIENLQKFHGLFLNFQSRIILGKNFNWNTGKVYQKLGCYTMLVDSIFACNVTGEILGGTDFEFSNKNESQYHFNKELFDDSLLLEFLSENNTLDNILYDIISSRKILGNLPDSVVGVQNNGILHDPLNKLEIPRKNQEDSER